MTEMGYRDDDGGRSGWFGALDWGAIIASVVAGFGLTLLLTTFGAAAGIEAADDDGNAGRIAAAVGTWTVLSAILGTLAGTFIGGRFSRWQSPGSSVYHAITSWGLATLLGALLGAIGALGVLGAALRRADATGAGAAQGAGDEISWGGWALWFGLLLTLAAAIAGWWLGARTRVTDVERDTPRGYGARAGFASDTAVTDTTATRRATDVAQEEERPTTWTGT